MGGGTVFSSVGKHAEICVCFSKYRSHQLLNFVVFGNFQAKKPNFFQTSQNWMFHGQTHGISTLHGFFPEAKAPTSPGVPIGTFDGFCRLRWHDATTEGKRSVPSSGDADSPLAMVAFWLVVSPRFFIFTPKTGEDEPNLTFFNIFQRG